MRPRRVSGCGFAARLRGGKEWPGETGVHAQVLEIGAESEVTRQGARETSAVQINARAAAIFGGWMVARRIFRREGFVNRHGCDICRHRDEHERDEEERPAPTHLWPRDSQWRFTHDCHHVPMPSVKMLCRVAVHARVDRPNAALLLAYYHGLRHRKRKYSHHTTQQILLRSRGWREPRARGTSAVRGSSGALKIVYQKHNKR